MPTSLLDPHTFLHRINTIAVKKKTYIKKDNKVHFIHYINYFRNAFCQGSEYIKVLNMSVLHEVLKMPEYAWFCLAEYARICLNMPQWLLLNISPLQSLTYLKAWSIIFESLIFQRLHKIRTFGLRENEAIFLETQNLIFSIVAERIWFGFCFKLNIFTSKISNLRLLSGMEAANLGIPDFSLLFLVALVLKHNVDGKNMQNIDVRIHVKLELQEIGC